MDRYFFRSHIGRKIRYSVGLVVKYGRYVCVIRGWDPECDKFNWMSAANKSTLEAIGHEGVNFKQPFYHVLVAYTSMKRLVKLSVCFAPQMTEWPSNDRIAPGAVDSGFGSESVRSKGLKVSLLYSSA